MNNSKNVFTIKDLENLTGIKAHTIRIWEKRYEVLQPLRADNNTRVYDTHALQKLMNISTLNAFGYKISSIAKFADEKIPVMVREIISSKTLNNHVINNFKLAMMNFDQPLFSHTYNTLLIDKSFRDIFYDCFMPLLEEIGALWQTDTITPAHEHFISYLIKQKIASNTEKLQAQPPTKTDRVFVLYLPEGEIHEIGLMLLNYELVLNGYPTINLGESVPIESLKHIKGYFDNITFVTYLTTHPQSVEISQYISDMKEHVVNDDTTTLFAFGRNSENISNSLLDDRIRSYKNIREFADSL